MGIYWVTGTDDQASTISLQSLAPELVIFFHDFSKPNHHHLGEVGCAYWQMIIPVGVADCSPAILNSLPCAILLELHVALAWD